MKGKSQEKRRTKRAVQSSNEATILKLVLLEYAVVAVVAILFTSLFVAVAIVPHLKLSVLYDH
jgi:hypothetical protein